MKILIIGSGGREHALAWKAAQSKLVEKIYVAPGNAGTALENTIENIDISATDIDALLKFAKSNAIDLTMVGPEAPLALGIVDKFQAEGLSCFGPSQAAAQLEASKEFAKDFMAKHHIPTAEYQSFSEVNAAKDYVASKELPIVIKADGLAAGKGVVIAMTLEEAYAAIDSMLKGNQFGEAGHRIVIEEFLQGEEASFIVACDGKTIVPFASSQDHKARDDGDKGPNTGGMGAYSPAPVLTEALEAKAMETVIKPTIEAMAKAGTPFVGFLYAGLMINPNGSIKVLEFNCRLGDPEAEVLLMRLQSDLVELCFKATQKKLHEYQIKWDPRSALGVVIASAGYPNSYEKGLVIHGLNDELADCKVFHAGTAINGKNIVNNGGRVLCVTALGNTLKETKQLAYHQTAKIHWEGAFYRSDIGDKAL